MAILSFMKQGKGYDKTRLCLICIDTKEFDFFKNFCSAKNMLKCVLRYCLWLYIVYGWVSGQNGPYNHQYTIYDHIQYPRTHFIMSLVL